MTPAQAIGWELWRRHRRGFSALGAYLVVLVTVKLVIIARGVAVVFDSEEKFAFAVTVPMSCGVLYLLAVFTYGTSGDLAARQSMYPARMFALPVSNAALVGWPMLYGAVAIAVFWTVVRAAAPWPADLAIPTLWPVTLGVGLIMWTQAATWMPYPFHGARLIAAVVVLQSIDGVVLLFMYGKASEWAILAFTTIQIPLAYLAGRYAIARSRRGATFVGLSKAKSPAWQILRSAQDDAPFCSAASAQAWFEWRRHGRALPIWVAIVLPFVLLVLWAAGTSTALVVTVVLAACFTPVVLALFSGVAVARSGNASDWFGLPAFSAARPLTDGQLLAAKLTMTVWSTLAAWAIVAVAVPVALAWSGTWPLARDFGRHMAEIVGPPRAIAMLALVVASLVLSTWRQLVQSLCVGLTGNERLIKGSMFASIALASVLGPVAIWMLDEKRIGVVWSSMPIILAVLVGAKMIAGGWVAARLVRARTLSDRALLTGAVAWTALVLVLFASLAWLADTPHIPRYLAMLIAIALVPLARISAAPLAVQQNRHR